MPPRRVRSTTSAATRPVAVAMAVALAAVISIGVPGAACGTKIAMPLDTDRERHDHEPATRPRPARRVQDRAGDRQQRQAALPGRQDRQRGRAGPQLRLVHGAEQRRRPGRQHDAHQTRRGSARSAWSATRTARVASRSAAKVARDTSGKITNVTTSSAWYGRMRERTQRFVVARDGGGGGRVDAGRGKRELSQQQQIGVEREVQQRRVGDHAAHEARRCDASGTALRWPAAASRAQPITRISAAAATKPTNAPVTLQTKAKPAAGSSSSSRSRRRSWPACGTGAARSPTRRRPNRRRTAAGSGRRCGSSVVQARRLPERRETARPDQHASASSSPSPACRRRPAR